MTDSPKLNLRQKLIQVYADVDHVEKAGRNSKQNYNFVRAADVLRAIRDTFLKLGIYAETNYELLGTYDIKTNSGGIMHTATVKATIVLHDADSDETMTISGLGDGADSGDKGIFKAQTGATKNALRNGTLLPDEADPEADEAVDDRTTGSYTHNSSTTELPDFQDAQRGPARTEYTQAAPKAQPRAEAPKTAPVKPQAAPKAASEPPAAAEQPVAQDATPEHGDAWEGPDAPAPTMPTEVELTEYRAKFKILGDDLSAKGKLKSSQGLPINRKLLVFLLGITKAADAKVITKAQWDDFFRRVDEAKANAEVGLVGITKLVNKANGLEDKK